VLIVFVLNRRPQEIWRGEGAFRHIECERITQLKQEIRERFNPRLNGKRTEEHVVHASDNQSQVDHMLRLLGHKRGLTFLRRQPNAVLRVPYYVPGFSEFTVRRVRTDRLFGRILTGAAESHSTRIVPLEDSPHYACLRGDREAYAKYLARHLGHDLTSDYSPAKFITFSRELDYLASPHSTSYILAEDAGPGRYVIVDGLHRACILRFRGETSFPVAVI
jgi:hypothetical protein